MTTRISIGWAFRAIGSFLILCWTAAAFAAVEPRITSPLSHTAVPASATPSIQFKGTYPYVAGTKITVQALNPSGGWSNLGTATLQSNGNWAVTVAVSSLFYFEPCGVGVFRAMPSDGKPQLPVSDKPCLDAAPPDTSVCVKDMVVLSQPGRHPSTLLGNLSVLGKKQAEKFACYHDVQGSLSISGSPPSELVTWLTRAQAEAEAKLSMPNLSHVSGDLKAVIEQFIVLPVATTGGYATAVLDLPALSEVGGSINLRAVDLAHNGSSGHQYVFGLDALTTVGANVTIENQVAHNHYVALGSLTEIPGNLTINWTKSSDLLETQMLQSLQLVHGNVLLNAKSIIQTLLPNLTSIDGNLTVQATGFASVPYSMIANLSHVGGDLSVLGGFKWDCSQPTFPDLLSVNGRLVLDGGAPRGTLGATGLSLGGLQITNTQVTKLPLPASLQMASTGPVDIQLNTKLCQCQVNAFIASLQSAGWTGTPPPTNNGSAAMCSPCPAPTCQ